MEQIDIVIIGGGPAGLAAALGAKEGGAKSILLLERDRVLGGILNQCIHDGFGLFMFGEILSGPEFADNLISRLHEEKIPYETDAMVLEVTSERLIKYNSPRGYKIIQAKAVIFAMGCRERTRGMIGIPGSRPAGVLTAGSAQNLVNMHNLRIGKRIVILGSGDIGLIMARRLTLEGMKVLGVYEIMPWCNGLNRNVRQCLNDYEIPLYLSTTVIKIHGEDRLEGVTVCKVDNYNNPLIETEEYIECDTLLLSVGLIPENELTSKAGIELSPITKGAIVNEKLMSSRAGFFSCGNVLHIHDVADYAAEEGFHSGKEAAAFVNSSANSNFRDERTVSPGTLIRYCIPQRYENNSENLAISFRVVRPLNHPEIIIEDSITGDIILKKKYNRLIPSELERLLIKQQLQNDIRIRCNEQ